MTDQLKMRMSVRIQAVGLIFLTCILFFSCSKNVLTFKYKKDFSERDEGVSKNDRLELSQIVFYNKPNTIDEEYSHHLTFLFLQSKFVKKGTKYHLPNDSLAIKIKYDLFSIWNWEDESVKVSGTVFILDFQPTFIKLKENITITDFRRNRVLKFKGKRLFVF